ncbi:MAG: DUF4921 family protein [Gemmataceae bacterium]
MDDIPFLVPQFRVRRLPAPELRQDPVTGRWTIISTDRLARPQEVRAVAPPTRLETCPFCAGHEVLTPVETYSIRSGGNWRVRVVPNMYPALLPTGGPAHGRHEVVVECPHHEVSLANLAADHVADVLRVYRDRIVAAKHDPRLVYPFVFKNQGADAGASLEHAHSQLVLLPRVPLIVAEELAGGAAHHATTGRCIYCDLLSDEGRSGERLVLDSPRFIALLAYAGRFPFETWLLPKPHASHFETISDDEAAELGEVLRSVLRKLAVGLGDPPYNFFVHTSPLSEPPLPHYHWHLELLPRVAGVAGFECGTGCAINPVPPEQAAAYLRGVNERA